LERVDLLFQCCVEILDFLFLLPNVLPLCLSLLLATQSRGFAEVAGAFALRFVDRSFPTTLCRGRLSLCGGSLTLRRPLRPRDGLPYFKERADEIVTSPRHAAEYRRAASSSLIVAQQIRKQRR